MKLHDLVEILTSLNLIQLELDKFPSKGQGPELEKKREVSIKYIDREIKKIRFQLEQEVTLVDKRRGF